MIERAKGSVVKAGPYRLSLLNPEYLGSYLLSFFVMSSPFLTLDNPGPL